MLVNERRQLILNLIKEADSPIKAGDIAEQCLVTRQVIVNDISILRAEGNGITSTSKGYTIEKTTKNLYVIECDHSEKDILEELYIIADCGCGVLNVIVEHDVYGEIIGNIEVFNRFEADEFYNKFKNSKTVSLSALTNNRHMHTLSCPSEKRFEEVKKRLVESGFIVK